MAPFELGAHSAESNRRFASLGSRKLEARLSWRGLNSGLDERLLVFGLQVLQFDVGRLTHRVKALRPSERFVRELDAMRGSDQPADDGIRNGRLARATVPALDR